MNNLKKLLNVAEKQLKDDVRRFNLDVLEEFTLIEAKLTQAGGGTRTLSARIPKWVTDRKGQKLGDIIYLAVGRKVKRGAKR